MRNWIHNIGNCSGVAVSFNNLTDWVCDCDREILKHEILGHIFEFILCWNILLL